jgi:hypothetical protein
MTQSDVGPNIEISKLFVFAKNSLFDFRERNLNENASAINRHLAPRMIGICQAEGQNVELNFEKICLK